MLVHKSFDTEVINIPPDNIEQIFVLVKWGNNLKFIIGAFYLPPSSPSSTYSIHTETVQ